MDSSVAHVEKYTCNLDQSLQEIALFELNEEPEKREIYLGRLRCWIQDEGFVSGGTCTENATLLKFLRHSKFSYEKTQENIKRNLASRTSIPEWYLRRDPQIPALHQLIKQGLVIPMQYDQNGSRLVIARIGHFDTATQSFDDVMKLSAICSDFLLLDEITQINGLTVFVDFSEFGFRHACLCPPSYIKKIFMMIQDCSPFRIKGIHCWKTPFIFFPLYSIAQHFLKEKLRKRFHLHGNSMKSLHSQIDPEYLPNEYGGTAGPLQSFIDLAEKDFLQFRDQLLRDDDYQLNMDKLTEPA